MIYIRFLFIHFIWVIGRISAGELLHSPLYSIFGIFPVGVLVAVVEFFHQP